MNMSRMRTRAAQWTNTEDEILKAGMQKYGMNNWERVASLIDTHSARECKDRWYQFLDPTINKGEWSRAEEEKLVEYHDLFPEQWAVIASQIERRTAWQCEQHYEALLQRVQAAGNGDVRQVLRPLEQMAEAEIRPARPDAITADDAEKDMVEAAVARLANRHGKKGLRTARKDQLDEATAIAQLEREREMKLSGHTSGKVNKRIQQALQDDMATRGKRKIDARDDDDVDGAENEEEQEDASNDGDGEMPSFEVNLQFKARKKKDHLVLGEKRVRTDDDGKAKKSAKTESVIISFDDDNDTHDSGEADVNTAGDAAGPGYLGEQLFSSTQETGVVHAVCAALSLLPAPAQSKPPAPASKPPVVMLQNAEKHHLATAKPFSCAAADTSTEALTLASAEGASGFVGENDDVPIDDATKEEAADLIREMKESLWIFQQHRHLPCEPGTISSPSLLAEVRRLVKNALLAPPQGGAEEVAAPASRDYVGSTMAVEQMRRKVAQFVDAEAADEAVALKLIEKVVAESEQLEVARRQLYFYSEVVRPAEEREAKRRLEAAQEELRVLEAEEDALQLEFQQSVRSRRAP
jgi:hypothetical protein